ELEAAGQRLKAAGHHRVLVRGAMRLPVWFAAGATLRHVQGFTVAGLQQGSIWSSDTATGAPARPEVLVQRVGEGTEIGVDIGVAADPSVAVGRFVREQPLPLSAVGSVRPAHGVGPEAVPDGRAAALLAVGIRDAV